MRPPKPHDARPDDEQQDGGQSAATLPTRAARLAAILEEWPRRTLTLEELWAAWDTADPASAGRATRRADLATALRALADVGALTASKTKDTTAEPALPTRITLPAPAPTPTAAALAQQTAWRPELDWAATTRLTLAQVERLRSVNQWLRDHAGDRDVMPMRERSLQIFGYEKVLDALVGTSVFGPERLTLDLLRTFRTHPPLPSRRVGSGPVLLVVENEDTFHTLWKALTTAPGRVGHIAWGAGAAFEASVRSTGDLLGVTRTAYFGDLDAPGLRIATSATRTALGAGMPAITPAKILYRVLVRHGRPQGGATTVPPDQLGLFTQWLDDEELAAMATSLLANGHRLAQEAVTANALAEVHDWPRLL